MFLKQQLSIIFFVAFILLSCKVQPRPVMFPVKGTDQVLLGLSREAVEGRLDLSMAEKLEYCFASTPAFMPPASFEIEYSFDGNPSGEADGRELVLQLGDTSWVLPFGPHTENTVMHYAVPCAEAGENAFPAAFTVALNGGSDSGRGQKPPPSDTVMRIGSVAFTERRFGLYRLSDASAVHVYAAPFVSGQGGSWTIDPPAAFTVPPGFLPVLSAELAPGKEAAVNTGGRRFEFSPRLGRLVLPAGVIAPDSAPLFVTGDRAASLQLGYAKLPPFPQPLTADPGLVLAWPEEQWRDSRYEVFRWERFPSLLIFDTADYAVQDRLFKRLAFFVEKAGFRGRLAPDAEIAALHGWNAHDYRAEGLADFFHLARTEHFPLSAEERELERILLNAGIIREAGGGIQAGEGGVISIAQESAEYLRFRFMAHEGFHGLFFIDHDFREFTRRRWGQFPAGAKRFLVSFFNFQRYDTADEYLLLNEFMAHILQQPAAQAAAYFGVTLPARLETTWRRADLPEKDEASGSWPALAGAFTREAEVFSAYVNERWGLAAGRVHLVTVRRQDSR